MGGLQRVLRRNRRAIAFLLAFVGVLFGLAALRDEPPAWEGLVISRDLPAGHSLTVGDIQVVRLSTAARPANALTTAAEAEGRVLAGPMVGGEMLLHSRLVGPGILAGGPPGHVAMPVRLDDPAEASFLRPGDHVDVLAARRTAELITPGAEAGNSSTTNGAEVVARNVVVLAIPGSGASGASAGTTGLLGGAGTGDAGGSVLVVSVAQAQAAEIAGAAANARLSVVLRPP